MRKIPQVYVDVLYGRAPSPLRREWQSNYRKTGNGGEFSFAAMAKRERERKKAVKRRKSLYSAKAGLLFWAKYKFKQGIIRVSLYRSYLC